MLAQMRSYTPSLYLPQAEGRYRPYPRVVKTSEPGAGYAVGEMKWAAQELNLDGSSSPQYYGSYSSVPLRGLGQSASFKLPKFSLDLSRSGILAQYGQPPAGQPPAGTHPDGSGSPALLPPPPPPPSPSFLARKVGPFPVWSLGLFGIAAIGGGTWYFMKRRKKVRPNRRRRR